MQDERDGYRERCRGMYAKNAMGGAIDPYINVVFSPIHGDEQQIVSMVFFAWPDVLDVGIPEQDGTVKPPLLPCVLIWTEKLYMRYSLC
jgi:hypothetical protein